jgi:hypothetical protein
MFRILYYYCITHNKAYNDFCGFKCSCGFGDDCEIEYCGFIEVDSDFKLIKKSRSDNYDWNLNAGDDMRPQLIKPIASFNSYGLRFMLFADGCIYKDGIYLIKLTLHCKINYIWKNLFKVGNIEFENDSARDLVNIFEAVVYNINKPDVSFDNNVVLARFNFNCMQVCKWLQNGRLSDIYIPPGIMGVISNYLEDDTCEPIYKTNEIIESSGRIFTPSGRFSYGEKNTKSQHIT